MGRKKRNQPKTTNAKAGPNTTTNVHPQGQNRNKESASQNKNGKNAVEIPTALNAASKGGEGGVTTKKPPASEEERVEIAVHEVTKRLLGLPMFQLQAELSKLKQPPPSEGATAPPQFQLRSDAATSNRPPPIDLNAASQGSEQGYQPPPSEGATAPPKSQLESDAASSNRPRPADGAAASPRLDAGTPGPDQGTSPSNQPLPPLLPQNIDPALVKLLKGLQSQIDDLRTEKGGLQSQIDDLRTDMGLMRQAFAPATHYAFFESIVYAYVERDSTFESPWKNDESFLHKACMLARDVLLALMIRCTDRGDKGTESGVGKINKKYGMEEFISLWLRKAHSTEIKQEFKKRSLLLPNNEKIRNLLQSSGLYVHIKAVANERAQLAHYRSIESLVCFCKNADSDILAAWPPERNVISHDMGFLTCFYPQAFQPDNRNLEARKKVEPPDRAKQMMWKEIWDGIQPEPASTSVEDLIDLVKNLIEDQLSGQNLDDKKVESVVMECKELVPTALWRAQTK